MILLAVNPLPRLAVLISFSLSSILCAFLATLFLLCLSWSPFLCPRTQDFPTELVAEGKAIVSCCREICREEDEDEEEGWVWGGQAG